MLVWLLGVPNTAIGDAMSTDPFAMTMVGAQHQHRYVTLSLLRVRLLLRRYLQRDVQEGRLGRWANAKAWGKQTVQGCRSHRLQQSSVERQRGVKLQTPSAAAAWV